MPPKKSSEKSRLLTDTDGYDSNVEIRGPFANSLSNAASVNNASADISPVDDLEASGNSASARLTESTRSSRSRGRPKSRSVLSEETDNYDILVDVAEPGTT